MAPAGGLPELFESPHALGTAFALLAVWFLHRAKPSWLPRALLALTPENRFSPRWRWAVLCGEAEEEAAAAYQTERPHLDLTVEHERRGDVFVKRRRGREVLFVRSTTGVRHVLLSEAFAKVWQTDGEPKRARTIEYVHNLVQPLLADPVFGKKGSTNREARSTMSPLFHGSSKLAEAFGAEIDAAFCKWPAGAEADVLALVHEMIRGCLYRAIAGAGAKHLHAIATPAFESTLAHFVSQYSAPAHEQEMSKEDEAAMEGLRAAALKCVAEFRADCTAAGGDAGNHTLLAILMSEGFSDAECAAVLCNVVIAGAEAPASALAHTLRELASRPELQTRLKDEIGAAVGEDDPATALSQLELVKNCVLEGLRLFAPATLVKRQALTDATVDGVAVPAATVVELCITAIHRDEKQFDEPLDFNPERAGLVALPLVGRERAYMAFSGGLRGCPGRPLALTIMNIALAKCMQRFQLEPASVTPAKKGAAAVGKAAASCVCKFVEWPTAGVPVRLERSARRTPPSTNTGCNGHSNGHSNGVPNGN